MMDLKAIRAKIEKLKLSDIQISQELDKKTQQRFYGRNDGISDALAIIDSHVEPKDEPTEAGCGNAQRTVRNTLLMWQKI